MTEGNQRSTGDQPAGEGGMIFEGFTYDERRQAARPWTIAYFVLPDRPLPAVGDVLPVEWSDIPGLPDGSCAMRVTTVNWEERHIVLAPVDDDAA